MRFNSGGENEGFFIQFWMGFADRNISLRNGLCSEWGTKHRNKGFYQTYRSFSFKTGVSEIDIPETNLNGGGFTIAKNLAPWFAMWTQLTFYGAAEQPNHRVRIINNLQGLRWQTKLHGPLQFYAKGGVGFSHYSMDIEGSGFGEYKFSVAYGGGAFIWASEHFGIVLDATHTMSGLPNLTDLSGRDKWDSGLTLPRVWPYASECIAAK